MKKLEVEVGLGNSTLQCFGESNPVSSIPLILIDPSPFGHLFLVVSGDNYHSLPIRFPALLII